MRAVALLKVGRDYGVTFLDLKIAGLRETDTKLAKYAEELEMIQNDLIGIMPKLKEMYVLDITLEDTMGRRYIARFYTYGGIVYYAILISPKSTMGTVLKKLTQQGWKLLILIERKAVKKSASETDVR
ncbi:conserved hypothetical protein [Pyrobaculum islandicum DSM 4184]|uniref:Uncharacterized protein n=1 Tax=Pyrobaculum islandicum (strain DSM 4184 / JCM 9189 / GEO3) TaxID=384616 RepID=A1RRG9_PYRIL|nr:hypothetical protein [Pyrobaculum islandicum]ABL87551.1 conserved hypothetical protein [Pyrobaculum islandicum DSM 4184]